MLKLDARSLAVGALIGGAVAVSVGAAALPRTSDRCPWQIAAARTTGVVWRLNTETGALDVCNFEQSLDYSFLKAACEPLPPSVAPSPRYRPQTGQ